VGVGCQDTCPVHATAKSLNPRRTVHDIKLNLLGNGPEGRTPGTLALIGDAG
jgi:hypothetical protein